jgi:mRNA interferase MazF
MSIQRGQIYFVPMETVFLCFQLRSLDHRRFSASPAGHLKGDILQRVEDAVRYCLGL